MYLLILFIHNFYLFIYIYLFVYSYISSNLSNNPMKGNLDFLIKFTNLNEL